MKRILHLTLHRRWFDAIASGRKTREYRNRTPYWHTRLNGRTYDEIHFRNGYAKDAPFMRVEWRGISVLNHDEFGEVYAIQLGQILEIKNWKGEIK